MPESTQVSPVPDLCFTSLGYMVGFYHAHVPVEKKVGGGGANKLRPLDGQQIARTRLNG